MSYKNDMTMMLAMHEALRRELGRIARLTERPDDDPVAILRTAAGWEMFKSYLHVHHGAEDDILWPPMRQTLRDNSAGLELLDAMEQEHAKIDPLLVSIDLAVADPGTDRTRLGELADALNTSLRAHLEHEEDDGLALIDATVTPEVWQAFRAEHGRRVSGDTRYFPWVFDEASPDTVAAALATFPAPLQKAYTETWEPAYEQLTIWPNVPAPRPSPAES